MDLETAMQESRTAIHLFFNNKFEEAWEMLRPWFVVLLFNRVLNITLHSHFCTELFLSNKMAFWPVTSFRNKNFKLM